MSGIEGPGVIGGSGGGIPTTSEVITVDDETATLPNSRVLTAGTNVTLDATTPGELIINAAGGGGGSTVPTTVQGDTLFASAVNVLSALAKNTTATRYLANTGTNNNPAWGQINLANGVTGTLPVGNGGTGATTLSGVLHGNGASAFTAANVALGSEVSGTLPVTNGGTGVATFAQGDLIYGSAADTLSALTKDANATRYLANTGTSNNPAWGQVNLANGVTGDLPFANLAQGTALSVLGVTGNATADVASIAAASDGNVLRRSGTALTFGAIDLTSTNAVTGILGAANGGTANGFTAFTGPTTSTKTFTLPNASATILTDNAAVTVAQGGTGITSGTSGGIPYYSASNTIASSAALTSGGIVLGGGAGAAPVVDADLSWNSSTNVLTFGSAATAPSILSPNNASGNGPNISITAGNAGGAGPSSGGAVLITGGAGATTGTSGGVSLQAGTPIDGAGGTIRLIGANGVGTNRAGSFISLEPGVPTGSGTAGSIQFVNTTTTGAQTATFTATNKPGSGTTAPSLWLRCVAGGTTYYIPMWQ